MECKNLESCSFVECCKVMNRTDSVRGFIKMYCKGDKMEACKRLILLSRYGKETVPPNMMPNGFPLPGTNKSSWSKEAMNCP